MKNVGKEIVTTGSAEHFEDDEYIDIAVETENTEETLYDPQMSFLEVVGAISRGRSAERLSDSLQRVILEARETGEFGVITYKLKIARVTDNRVSFEDSIGVVLPTVKHADGFYIGRDGGLSSDDPNVPTLFDSQDTPAPVDTVTGELYDGPIGA